MKYNRYLWLDFIRGFSAILVCAGHLRAALFEPFSNGNVDVNIFTLLFYFLTSLGHEAVMVFFVLSGFFVGGSVLHNRNDFDFLKYNLIRLSRLWIVLIPALIFTFFIDLFISRSVLNGGYASVLNSGPISDYSLSIITFFYNVFFLQTIVSPVFGSNGALWSLANEFWYYITFPLVLYVFGCLKSTTIIKICSSIIILFLCYFSFRHEIFYGFFIWLLGVGVYKINNYIDGKIGIFFKMLSMIQFVFVTIICNYYTFPLVDFIFSLSFSLCLLSLINISDGLIVKLKLKKIIITLSDMSYSLYLFHFPVVLLIYSLFFINGKLILNIYGLVVYFFFMLVLLLVGYIAWFMFERYSLKVRLFILDNYEHNFKRSLY